MFKAFKVHVNALDGNAKSAQLSSVRPVATQKIETQRKGKGGARNTVTESTGLGVGRDGGLPRSAKCLSLPWVGLAQDVAA
jgi:hypothetical protein